MIFDIETSVYLERIGTYKIMNLDTRHNMDLNLLVIGEKSAVMVRELPTMVFQCCDKILCKIIY
jgi:hypothetical protein